MLDSPKVNPYPSWAEHQNTAEENITKVISAVRVKVDTCDRLWVLDTGVVNDLGMAVNPSGPRILIYNLTTDELLKSYSISNDLVNIQTSNLKNLVVDSMDCNDSYAYIADSGYARLIVYSESANDAWRLKHNYFNFDPILGNLNKTFPKYQISDAIFGLALRDKDLYFHSLNSYNEFKISTEILQNKTKAEKITLADIEVLGTRGVDSQAGASVWDQNTGVIFYALINLNTIGCWRINESGNYSMEFDSNMYVGNNDLLYPSDIVVDRDNHLWVLSNNLPKLEDEQLNPNDINFRILWGTAKEVIRDSACDPNKPKASTTTTITNQNNNNTTKSDSNSSSMLQQSIVHILSITLIIKFLQKLL